MCGPPSYHPGGRNTKILYFAEGTVSLLLVVLFLIEFYFGTLGIIFSQDTKAPATVMPVYTALGNTAFYPLTRWGGLDFVVLTLGPMSIITYGLPIVLSMISYKDWITYIFAYTILTVGGITEIVRSIWFIIATADANGFWYSAAWGTVATNFLGPFAIISLFSWIRAVYFLVEIGMLLLLKYQGIRDVAQDEKYGIQIFE